MKPFIYTIIFLAFVSLTGCNTSVPQDDPAQIEKIKLDTGNWIKGTAKGDVDDYFHFITDDFVFIGQGKPISGKDSLRSFLTTAYANYTVSMPKWESEEIDISDNIAIHRYSGIVYIRSKKDNLTVESDRKYLDVLKKNEGGEWKVYLHAFNLNR